MLHSKSTLIFSPEEQNLGLVDVTIRYLVGAEALVLVVACVLPTPHFIFALSVIGFYMAMTAMISLDPVYLLLQLRSVPLPMVRVKQYFWHRFLSDQKPGDRAVEGA
jgi:hypothetical protein